MEIIKTNLKFKSLVKRDKTSLGIFHHTACSNATPEQIHSWHLDNGWSGAGYNLYIRKNGVIYELRPVDCVGAHASGSNSNSVGICFEGNFEVEQMTQAQIESGKWICNYLRQKYPSIIFKGHKDVCSTSCPGKNFRFDEIANSTTKNTVTSVEVKKEVKGNVATIQSTLNSRYNLNIAVDNIYRKRNKESISKSITNRIK